MTLDKTFNAKDVEARHYRQWEKGGYFASNVKSNRSPYTVMMPPPNVTGSLHMGHALNTTLQDILTRYARMRGKDALWQPGTDHAGIATQMVVERLLEKEGKRRTDMTREAFVEKVWEWKEYSGNTITEQLRRLGASPDWARERFTMDAGLSKAVLKVFVQLYKEGLIYRDKRLVNWDPKFRTAISDIEVEFKDVKGKFYHFRYPLEDGSGFIAIATTRPETILGDGAVAVHPDDERYKDLVGKKCKLPIVDRLIPIIADKHVKSDFGSGAVKITAAHDFNDFDIYKRHPDAGIPLINLMTPDAKMNENCPAGYQGLDRFKAREKVVEDFEALGLLDKIEDYEHSVPYGERSGVVTEPYLTDQWYVDAKTLAAPAIAAVEDGRTEIIPKTWEKTYFEWMRNIQPWCISRQLWWGHQIPAWYGPDGTVFVEESEDEVNKAARLHYGEDVKLTRDTDVLDTWFSSALWPFSTLGWPEETPELQRYYPTDDLVTGFDIIFYWVARMMMMGLHFMGEVPFRKIYMHALVRDEKGQKMSKSKGNIIDPLDLIDKYGADALRFTLTAMAAQGRDIKLSENRVEGYRNFATKLWNAARYCEMNKCLPSESFHPDTVKETVNKWIVSELVQTCRKVEDALDGYKFNEAATALYQFAWGTFCDWYLEFTKPLLADGNPAQAETRDTAGWVLGQLLLMLHPIMPYLSEELHAHLTGEDKSKLMQAYWPELADTLANENAQDEMNWIVRLISEVRRVRADMNVPAGAKIALFLKGANAKNETRIGHYQDIICRMARLEKAEILNGEIPKGAVQAVVDEATLVLPIAGVVDIGEERGRLQREIDKVSKDIQKIEAKLGNKSFLEKAPEEVVAEQHARKAEAESMREKLNQALQQLDVA